MSATKIILLLPIYIFLCLFAHAQNLPTTNDEMPLRNNLYFALFVGAGMNSWQVRASQFTITFPVSANELIYNTKSISEHTYAPNINFGVEIGGYRSGFLGFDMQFTFGGMIGSYFGISGGKNIPLGKNSRTLLQIGSGAFYQIATKELDRRILRQSTYLQGRFFDTNNTFTTSLIDENVGLRPFASLRFPMGRIAHIKITGGHQFNFLGGTRIRFSQNRPSRSRNDNSNTTARFYPDDNLFDFQYNNQKISRTPFDYSGFFVNVAVSWVF
jgi:hypothetical protein